MKNYILGFSIFLIMGCTKNRIQHDSTVSYVNFDTLNEISSFSDESSVDSLFSIKYDSIVHLSILIDSIKYFIVEGDLLLDEYEYTQYKISTLMPIDAFDYVKEQNLVGEIKDDTIAKWPENYVLKYCIAKNSFKSIEQYNLIRENMINATKEWEKACNIKFYYDEKKDNRNIFTPTSDLTFVVLGFNAKGRFIASSFFPYDPPTKRRLLIDPSYFNTNFDRIGVLRHELGHTLGFRHEHIRGDAPKICPGEDLTGTVNLTLYDPKSVMHYFCGGMGTIKLEITDIDRLGAQTYYGLPKNQ